MQLTIIFFKYSNDKIAVYFHIISFLYRKNDFSEISESLARDLKIILLNHKNNYVGRSSIMSNATKNNQLERPV